MVKKNKHRAGRKKREKILRAQLLALSEGRSTKSIIKPTARIAPRAQEPHQREPVAPLVDLTIEEPLQFNPYSSSDEEIEFLAEVTADDSANLEPLDPHIEFRHNVTQLFVNLEEYARSIFEITE